MVAGCTNDLEGVVVINEVVVAPVDTTENPRASDWVELFNRGAEEVSLHGCRLHDQLDDFDDARLLPSGTRLPGRGHLVVYFSRDPSAGTPRVDLGLRPDEEVVLYGRDGVVIDRVDWNEGDCPPGASYGRSPDGGPALRKLSTITPGGPNG